MSKIAAIVGAGLVGRAWAIVFARAGWTVRLHDPAPEAAAAALALVGQGMRELAAHGLVDDPEAALDRVSIAASLEAAVEGAALVQENGPERLAIKVEIFEALDRAAPPGAILASSTSAIPPSAFTVGLAGRARCLVGHPVNPPHLIPLVELCGAPWTAPETIARAHALYEAVGQAPIVVRREVEGFVLNRLQGALLTEAFHLVREGVVSPDDLDRTMRDGLGLRWAFMGPFETIELNAPGGIPDYVARYGPFYRRVAGAAPGDAAWDEAALDAVTAARRAIPPEDHANMQAWRDGRLAGLVAHKRHVESG